MRDRRARIVYTCTTVFPAQLSDWVNQLSDWANQLSDSYNQ